MKFPWTTPTSEEMAAKQLEEAKRDLMQAEACEEHYHHQVIMLKERVARLNVRSGSVPQPLHLIPASVRLEAA